MMHRTQKVSYNNKKLNNHVISGLKKEKKMIKKIPLLLCMILLITASISQSKILRDKGLTKDKLLQDDFAK